MAAIVAYPLKTDISERDASGAGEPDIEPDDQWKEETRKQIEGGLWHFVEEAKQKRDDELSLHSTSPTDQDRVKKEYDDRMAELRKMAEAEFHVLLQYEKKLRRWAVLGEIPDPEIVRLQRERMAAIQRNTQQHSESSSAREQGGQSVFKSASAAQSGKAEPAIVDRATNATEARQDDSPTSAAKKPNPLSGISVVFNKSNPAASEHCLDFQRRIASGDLEASFQLRSWVGEAASVR
ncbi:uncharacterized protein LAESUDRAFT_428451 [Laetiporus sulphureus 93-53]|uniref:Uncharacterized protein n=1 Tax=Laetiporus sulphureus 93-53 TaxID=1314785 RepID=A0A165GLI1_9APHY|nr:uncharacterized protein LAESUDRAFT_428451 [Laetiporus sulphureus 93-53]KZT10517.1 hypothetical protein LAESUDRAFT_428451 [Laetiporus sulphureus 93-53]